MPVKSGYTYYKEVPVNHTDDGAQNLYQMKLLVGESSGATGEEVDCEGHCLSNFNDLWFQGYDADGSTIIDLDYWIESITGTTPNQLATVWVEIHYIPAHPDNTTVWMSYGKAGASAASSGENTFPFFDHFDDDLSKWTGDTAEASLASSIMSLSVDTGAHSIFSSSTMGIATFAVRALSNVISQDTNTVIAYLGLINDPTNTVYSRMLLGWAAGASANSIQYNGGSTASNFTKDSWVVFDEIVRAATNVRYFEDGVEKTGSPQTTNPPNTTALKIQVAGQDTTGNNVRIQLDWVLRRNYTLNEPTWGAWGAEQAIPNIKQFYYPHILAH